MNIETTAEPIREGLPSLPKGKMLSGMDMESLHVLYTAGQMQDYAHAALAARAAAPVSGPSDAKLAVLRGNVEHMLDNLDAYGPSGKEPARVALDGVLDEIDAILAAPVSGQGASIGDDEQFVDLARAYRKNQTSASYRAMCAYIDSRPRSEDSRAKILSVAKDIHELGLPEHARVLRAALASTSPKADNE